jgi:transketolase
MNRDMQKIANKLRKNVFVAIANAGGGHFGGCLSVIEILTALYFKVLRINPHDPSMVNRDRVILSKGHAGPTLYVILAEIGFFPKEWLCELDQDGSRLPKHIDRLKTPGVDYSSGALGQGLSVGVGMALAAKLNKTDIRVYVVLGDGECNEGQVWEAASTASKYELDNLTAIIDRNRMQVDGLSDDVMPIEPFEDRWRAFGWHTLSVNGHDIDDLLIGIEEARKTRCKPTAIIARTIKGKGVSFMEGDYSWHSGKLTDEQYRIGIDDLQRLDG